MLNEFPLEFHENLDKDERLLWSAKPKAGIVFRTSDIAMIPFSILWCGFAVFWMFIAAKGSILFAMFGIPFVIIGLIMVFGRFFIDAQKRKNTVYGLTQNLIIIKSGVFTQKIKSLNIKTLSDITLSEKGDGTGTISLGPTHFLTRWYSGMHWWPGMPQTPQLEMIDDAQRVYNQIIKLQR